MFFIPVALFFYFEVRVLCALFTEGGSGASKFFRKKAVRIAAAACVVLAVVVLVDAFFIEPDWVVKEMLAISSPKLKKRVKIVAICDLHTEGYGKRHEKALQIVREAQPDIILLGGDYLNGSRFEYLPELRRFVSQLEAPFGVYAVGGNFDFTQCPAEMFEELGVRWLENETVFFEELGLSICGLRCIWDLAEMDRRFLKTVANENSDSFMLLLTHYPNHIEEPQVTPVDLYFCGHTHGGQIRLPLWGAIITLSKLGKKYECGHYIHGNTHVYVSRGLGMEGGSVPRVRFLCRPEVTVIELTPVGR